MFRQPGPLSRSRTLLAKPEGQASDDLTLTKKLITANALLADRLPSDSIQGHVPARVWGSSPPFGTIRSAVSRSVILRV